MDLLTQVKTQTLTPSQVLRLHHLVDEPILQVILKYGFLAGGSVVYVLVDDVSDSAVGDLDVFIKDEEHLRRCFEELCMLMKEPLFFQRKSSAVTIFCSPPCKPIQLILSYLSLESMIREFDMDFVQCAIHLEGESSLMASRTAMATLAHQSKQIRYMLDYAYNPMRLLSRLCKAQRKGFAPIKPINNLDQLGVPLYRPRRLTDAEWEREQTMSLPMDYVSQKPPTIKWLMREDPTITPQRESVMSEPFRQFTREEYDGDGRLVKEKSEPNYLVLEQTFKMYSSKKSSHYDYQRLLKKLEKNVDDHEAFYKIRALELMSQRQYQQAVDSAFSDSNKSSGNNGMFMFGQAIEQQIYLQELKSGHDPEVCAYNCIERLLGRF